MPYAPWGVRHRVYTSHNNRGWKKQLQVDRDFDYHVVSDMKHVLVLTLFGVATGFGMIDETAVVLHDVEAAETSALSSDFQDFQSGLFM